MYGKFSIRSVNFLREMDFKFEHFTGVYAADAILSGNMKLDIKE